MKMKKAIYRQNVTIQEFMGVHTRIINRTAYGAYLMALGVCSVVKSILPLPILVCLGISCVVAGTVYLTGYQFSIDKVNDWVRDLTEIRIVDEDESDSRHPISINENATTAKVATGPDQAIFDVEITWGQL